MRKVMSFPIKVYQVIVSPYLPPRCRFYPTCSHYAVMAIEHHGIGRGIWFALRRLMRCHPFSEGGYDPLLPNKEKL